MDTTAHSSKLVKRVEVNADALEQELQWLAQIIEARLEAYFNPAEEPLHFCFDKLPPPSLIPQASLTEIVQQKQLDAAERLVLALVITPYIRPQMLDILFSKNSMTERGFTEFGGLQSQGHGGFLPTIETALFLLAGDALDERFGVSHCLQHDAPLFHQGLIQAHSLGPHEPWTSQALSMPKEVQDQLTTGAKFYPRFSSEFPARHITTTRHWDELVLPQSILSQLKEIADWVKYESVLMHDWHMKDKLSPGYTALFYGPPGTGKTLSACLLGQYCQRPVYKIDLSLLVSKYIGETEKNLARIFDTAEHKDWILFFDEADALFGKRTQVDDARDRYANQEVSYLLQRIEEFNGVVILASNLKSNIDEAFMRRFHSIIAFPIPAAAERLKIWQQAFSEKSALAADVNLEQIAEKYEVPGGTIMNVVGYCSLQALSQNSSVIDQASLAAGLKREFAKEGRRI